MTNATKDKTTETEKTSRSKNTPGVGEATKAKTKDDKNTVKTARAVETTTIHTTTPSDNKQAKKAAALETMKAIGEAAKAMEASMGAKN